MQGVQVRSLLGELKPHMLHGTAKRNRSGHRGGRRVFVHFPLNPLNTVNMFLIKEGCGYFQGGTQQYVWGDVVLLYYRHFSIPTLLLCPFEDIEMGLAMNVK